MNPTTNQRGNSLFLPDGLGLSLTQNTQPVSQPTNDAILASNLRVQGIVLRGDHDAGENDDTATDQLVPGDRTATFQPSAYRLDHSAEETTNDNDDDDISMLSVSMSNLAPWNPMQLVLPLPYHSQHPYSPGTDWGRFSRSWQQLQDRQAKVRKHRQDLTGLRSLLRQKQREKAEVEREFHILALSCSKENQPPPRDKTMELHSRTERLNDICASVESQCDELGAKLDRDQAQLEALEAGLLSQLASEAAESHAGTSMERPFQAALSPGISGLQASQVTRTPSPGDMQRSSEIPGNTFKDKKTTHALYSMDTILLGISKERPRDEHPIYRQLLRATGDLRVAREGYEDLCMERDEIIGDLQTQIALERSRQGKAYHLETLQAALQGDYRSGAFRDAFSSYLDPDNLEFLRTWHDETQEALADIAVKERRVQQMRDWCRKAGVLPAYMSMEEQETVLDSVMDLEKQAAALGEDMMATFRHAYSSRSRQTVLAHPMFPKLLSNPYHLLGSPPVTAVVALKRALRLPDRHPAKAQAKNDGVKEYNIETMLSRSSPGNKADFVNRWLLQQLRTSCLAALSLFLVMSDTLTVINLLRWQDEVVYYWFLDDANKRTSFVYHSMAGSADSVSLGRSQMEADKLS